MPRIAVLSIVSVALLSGFVLCAGEDNPELERMKEKLKLELDRQRQDTIDKVQQNQQALRDRIKMKAAELDEQIDAMCKAGNDDKAVALKQTRAALRKRLAEAETQPLVAQMDDMQRVLAEKKQQPNSPARFAVK